MYRKIRFLIDKLRHIDFISIMKKRIALLISEEFLRRLLPVLVEELEGLVELHIVSVNRSLREIQRRIREIKPAVIVTEWLPGDYYRGLQRFHIPTIIVDSDEDLHWASTMDVDDGAVGKLAAEYFLERGYENFGVVSNKTPYSDQRVCGFCNTLAAHGYRCQEWRQNKSLDNFYLETSLERDPAWLSDFVAKTQKGALAVFAVHDPLARMMIELCQRHEMEVPKQVSVLGVNNDPLICGLTNPPLSSIILPWLELARQISKEVLRLGGNESPIKSASLPPQGLHVRESTDWIALSDPLLERYIHFAKERYREGINVSQACHALRIDRRALERVCQARLKKTPLSVLWDIRLEAARQILQTRTCSISEVAEKAGFGSAERFIAVCKRKTGKTPKALR